MKSDRRARAIKTKDEPKEMETQKTRTEDKTPKSLRHKNGKSACEWTDPRQRESREYTQTHPRRANAYSRDGKRQCESEIRGNAHNFYWNFDTTSQNMDFVVSFKMPRIQWTKKRNETEKYG